MCPLGTHSRVKGVENKYFIMESYSFMNWMTTEKLNKLGGGKDEWTFINNENKASSSCTVGVTYGPVSYTHLDVYKRQELTFTCRRSWNTILIPP